MNYHVVFDASRNSSELAIFALAPVGVLLAALIGWALKGSSDPKEALKGKMFLLFSAVGFVFSLVLLFGHYSEYYRAKKALRTRDYQVIEGTVENFVPMPPGGHSTESFDIDKTSFRYGSGRGSIVFNSEWNHGYIHNGVQVRIAYKDEDILRIEVM
jgi:hypothetical protein